MIKQRPTPITEENFAPFGNYWNLCTQPKVRASKYEEYLTTDEPVYQPMRFGMTMCENGNRFAVRSMERHNTTEEVLFAADKPIVLSVAGSDPAGDPLAEDVRSFLLKPGDAVRMNKGIWHDACHAAKGEAFYYFMAHGTGQGDEIVWHDVQGPMVEVEL